MKSWLAIALLTVGTGCSLLHRKPSPKKNAPPTAQATPPAHHSAPTPEAKPGLDGSLSRRPPTLAPDVSFFAMGTAWAIYLGPGEDRSARASVRNATLREVALLEKTFSEWAKNSELRKHERAGLTKPQVASTSFLQGLLLAKDAYALTDGIFDITIGGVMLAKLKEPAGYDKLVIQGDKFSFTKDPKRLTFGGLIKGAAVSRVAAVLWRAGFRNFLIDAGGGNLAAAGSYRGESWLAETISDGVVVDTPQWVARSNSKQGHRQHIFDPQAPNRSIERTSVVLCRASTDPDLWFREGGLTDAFTKALIIRPDLRNLPQGCESRVSQSLAEK